MPTYSGGNGAFTPSTSNDNWTLDAGTAGYTARIVSFGWGGRVTVSTGYRTRWTRPTAAGTGSKTALTIANADPMYTAPLLTLSSTFATTQPTLAADPAGNLWAQDWNAQGGVGLVTLPLNNQWIITNGLLQGELSCRNVAGTDASGSSYHVTWQE